MKIGIFFTTRKSNGGAYQYAVTLIEVLKKNPANRYVIFNMSPDLPQEFRSIPEFEIVDFPESKPKNAQGSEKTKTSTKTNLNVKVHNLLLHLWLFNLLKILTRKSQKKTLDLIKNKGVDLAIFTMTHKLGFLLDIPTIVPIHDVQHRLNPQFPEVSAGKIWAQREYICSQVAKHATRILVDSEIGKEDVISCYHPDSEKIVILPFLPPNYLKQEVGEIHTQEFIKNHSLPERFIFYPAQFWPHKNHINLVKATGILKQSGVIVNLVFTGAKKDQWGTWGEVENLMKQYGLEKQVFYLGYVDNDEINILYRKAVAMAMPTFLGPTNIPVYEAWSVGCPVLYSDIRGCREQAGDAAVLFDPANPEDMAKKIKIVWEDENLRKDLIEKGRKRLSLWTETDFEKKINETIKDIEVQHGH